MNPNLILFDQNDQQIGEASVIDGHLHDGRRHRAITAFLRDENGRFLMTKRSLTKPLWPTYWDAAYSTHPRVGETVEACTIRRSKEELGTQIGTGDPTCRPNNTQSVFTDHLSYEYHIKWNAAFSEWEINHILLANIPSTIDLNNINPEEISDYQWMTWDQITDWVQKDSDLISPWLTIAIQKIQMDPELKKIFSK